MQMLDSNVPDYLMEEILKLVPDTIDIPDEYWRIVPETEEGITYSVSSKRDILVKHTCVDRIGRTWKPKLVTMSYDCGVYSTAIRRSRKDLSVYIEHIRYDAFPELNQVKTLEDDINDAIDVPYDGLDWYGRKKTMLHMLPVSAEDMQQVRQFYPEDLPREVWAYVPETNRKYIISTQSRGVILKRYRVNGQILKSQIWKLKSRGYNGAYYECCLTVGDRQLNSVSHPQVIKSFIPKPDASEYYEVNHIDGDKHNNMLDNLEWVTRQENSDHYNKSPEMEYKRKIGYQKIAEWGRAHQKEVQNRPEVNAKRSETLKRINATAEGKLKRSKASKKGWTEKRKFQHAEYMKQKWNSYTEEEQYRLTQGIYTYNKHRNLIKMEKSVDESSQGNKN